MIDYSSVKIHMAGAGNVAKYLAEAFFMAGLNVDRVFSRQESNAKELALKVGAGWTDNPSEIGRDSDITVFALKDQVIEGIVQNIDKTGSFLVHTAGSLPMDILAGISPRFGVLYPLQTFSASRISFLSDIPLLIEANTDENLQFLRSLAGIISSNVYNAGTQERIYIHLAAVFACNFTNHMYRIAEELSEKSSLPYTVFHPLIMETAEKAVYSGPKLSQTGPAVRNDEIILKKHRDLLSCQPGFLEIYNKLSGSIAGMAGLTPPDENTENYSSMGFFKQELKKVKAFAFDVDGVFSGSTLLLDSEGELIRSMNVKDGFALQLAVRKGYHVAIITGGNSEQVRKRFNMLGVHDVYLKSSKKIDDFERFCKKHELQPDEVLYMGDDLPDYPVMEKAGFPTSPKDADQEIRRVSKYVSDRNGGEGCVRDVIEQVLRAQGTWFGPDTYIL